MKKFILARVDALGDFLLSIPTFYMQKQMYPDSELAILAKGQNIELAKMLPYVDRVFDYDDKNLDTEIADYNADVFLSLGLLSGELSRKVKHLAKISQAKIRGSRFKLNLLLSYNLVSYKQLCWKTYNEAELALSVLECLDKKLFESRLVLNTDIYYDAAYRDTTKKILKREKNILIHPFSRNSSVNLSPDDYARLVKVIRKELPDVGIIISAGANEARELNDFKNLLGNDEGVIYFCNTGNIFHLIALIDQVDIYIGGSTGPTHLASALGKCIVAMYPSQPAKLSPARWGVFANDKVYYPKFDEDFSSSDSSQLRYFKTYDDTHKEKIISYIKENLR